MVIFNIILLFCKILLIIIIIMNRVEGGTGIPQQLKVGYLLIAI